MRQAQLKMSGHLKTWRCNKSQVNRQHSRNLISIFQWLFFILLMRNLKTGWTPTKENYYGTKLQSKELKEKLYSQSHIKKLQEKEKSVVYYKWQSSVISVWSKSMQSMNEESSQVGTHYIASHAKSKKFIIVGENAATDFMHFKTVVTRISLTRRIRSKILSYISLP